MGRKRNQPIADPEAQPHFPGTEPVKNKKIHGKAVHYVRVRNARIAANAEEKEAHDTLLEAMIAEGIDDYEYGGVTVHVDSKRKCKVTSGSDKGEGEDDE